MEFTRMCCLVALVASVGSLHAQRPARQQEVRVPGIGVALKAGWQLFFCDGCRFAVPAPWRASSDGRSVFAPDGSTLSVRMVRITSWTAHKAQIKAAYDRVSVLHDDSDRRLWFEFANKPGIGHYIDVANGLTVCVGLLEVRAATTLSKDEVDRIADSIGPAPEHWPAGAR